MVAPKAASKARVEQEPTDELLVERVKAGDKAAFGVLVQRYERRVLRQAFSRLRNEQEALDVCQDAFVKAYRNIDQFQGNSGFYTWLYRIVHNRCIDITRRAGRGPTIDIDDLRDPSPEGGLGLEGGRLASKFAEPEAAYRSQEFWDEYSRALEGLSEKHREIFQLYHDDGMSYQDIADHLDIKIGTVMSRLHHARHNLQAALRRYFTRK